MAYQYSTTPLYVDEGDVIQFQYKAPPFWDYTETVTIQIGDLTQYWYIITVPEDFQPDPFPFREVNPAELNTLYVYGDGNRPGENIITVSGLTPTTRAGVSLTANVTGGVDVYSLRIDKNDGNGFGAWFQPSATSTQVENGHKIQVRAKSSDKNNKPVEVTLGIGLGYETWVITTLSIPSNIPNPFPEFTNLTNQKINIPTYSNIIRIQGLNTTASISVDGNGQYAISDSNATTTDANGFNVLTGATFTSTPGTITNGKYLQLKLQSSTNGFTTAQTSLSIGDRSAGSTWQVTTGASESTVPDGFVFTDISGAIEDFLIGSEPAPTAGISGLGTNVSVPVQLVSTTSSEVKIKINNGSIGVLPATVKNGDKITLYAKSSATFGATVETQISVGGRVIPKWQVTTNTGPDTSAVFTRPNNLTNRVPGSFASSSVVTITGINRPITISATNNALISIDYDTAVVGPRTFDPKVNSTFSLVLQASNSLDTSVSTTVTVGDGTDGNPFIWSVRTYATVPPASSNLGKWYSKKTDKFDGYPIGTVLPIFKEGVDDYGDLSGDLDSRYPGYLECDGSTYDVTSYIDLWNVIGNTYGGTGAYNSITNTYSGTFNVPDYRNRRLTGTGFVDGSKGSSAFLPVTTVGKGINDVGAEGGYWYFDKVDTSATQPFEQVVGTGTTGIDSDFFTLGTVRVTGLADIQDDIAFTISGSVTAQIGPLSDVLVSMPVHSHFYISAVVESESGDPLIPWNGRGLMGTDATIGESEYGGGGGDYFDRLNEDGLKYWKQFLGTESFTEFFKELGLYDGTSKDDFATQLPIASDPDDVGPVSRASTTVDFLTFWPSPAANTATPVADGRLKEIPGAPGSVREVTGVIDTARGTFRIDNYTPPNGTTNGHSHYLTEDPVDNPQTDFSGGNSSGVGTIGGGFGSGLGDASTAPQLSFNQSEVLMELTDGTFTFSSNIKQPVPDVALSPQRQVPILTPFHKAKYIIKAY